VLVPLLFGGIGAGLWAAIPAPFGLYVGGSICGAGLLLLLFLLWYSRRTARRRPFVASVIVGQWRAATHEYGGEALSVDAQVQQAADLLPTGYGPERAEYQGQTKSFVVTSRRVFDVVPPGGQALFLCMPTGELIAVDGGGGVQSA
jgi:hypothetical protein